MIAPKFIRFGKYVINIVTIEEIHYVEREGKYNDKCTKVSYQSQKEINIRGNVVDELWELIRLRMKSNNNDNNEQSVVEQRVVEHVEPPKVHVASEDDVA